jgi:hypothetical protein
LYHGGDTHQIKTIANTSSSVNVNVIASGETKTTNTSSTAPSEPTLKKIMYNYLSLPRKNVYILY